MYTDFPEPFAPHIMMLSERGTASGDLLVEPAADEFDVLSMTRDLDAGDSDHVRRGTGGSVTTPAAFGRGLQSARLLRLSRETSLGGRH